MSENMSQNTVVEESKIIYGVTTDQQTALVSPKQSILSKVWRFFYLTILFLVTLSVIYYLFFIPMQVAGNDPLDPFIVGKQIFSERMSYLFIEPKVGDGVVFKNSGDNYFGVITKICDVDNVKTYQVISIKNQRLPWEISKDKIVARIYYPSVKSIDLDSIVQSPTPALLTREDESNDWKKYESKVLHISLEYPSDWDVNASAATNSSNHLIVKSPGNSIFRIMPQVDESQSPTIEGFLAYEDKLSSTAWEGSPDMEVLDTKKTIIADLNTIQRRETLLAAGFTRITTYFKKSDLVIQLSLEPANGGDINKSDLETYDQILSTFKFTD